MKIPTIVTYRNFDSSDAIQKAANEWADKLSLYCKDIIRCNVMFEARHRHKHQGRLFNARVTVEVPGEDIVVSHVPEFDHGHEDPFLALSDAFRAVRRRLQDKVRLMQRQLKHHSYERSTVRTEAVS
jgi:ribosome-associated translation inhibitor RaiA